MKDIPLDKGFETMKRKLMDRTGKPLSEWIDLVNSIPIYKTSELTRYLKSEYGISTGYAGFIIYHAKQAKTGFIPNEEDLLEIQYRGKEHWRPLYEQLTKEVLRFGDDMEISPRSGHVSLRTKVQFAMLTPGSKSRFEIGLKLGDITPSNILIRFPNAGMCTHRIILTCLEDITQEVYDWLRKAYEFSLHRPESFK